jgi:sigma-E factor negative regulatory protein RseA
MNTNEHVVSSPAGESLRVEVSAFVDGELDDAAVERVIDALLASDELADFWNDAHRAGDWMRSDEVVGVGDGHSFLRRFSARLASEPAMIAAPRNGRSRSRRFWIRTGLPGASVAAALVVVAWVASPFGGSDDNGDRSAAAVPSVAIVQVAKPEEAAVKQAEWKVVDPERLSDYLAAHRDVTPFAYRGSAAARQASFNTVAPASSDAPTAP